MAASAHLVSFVRATHVDSLYLLIRHACTRAHFNVVPSCDITNVCAFARGVVIVEEHLFKTGIVITSIAPEDVLSSILSSTLNIRLYTQVVEAFSKVPNAMYTIAAAFGNVHGVYKSGTSIADCNIFML